jgi:hypothetical protein
MFMVVFFMALNSQHTPRPPPWFYFSELKVDPRRGAWAWAEKSTKEKRTKDKAKAEAQSRKPAEKEKRKSELLRLQTRLQSRWNLARMVTNNYFFSHKRSLFIITLKEYSLPPDKACLLQRKQRQKAIPLTHLGF